MGLSSKKSEACYNRAAKKIEAIEAIDAHFTYDPNEWMQDSCDHHTCTYCNPPIGQIRHNRLVWVLQKLSVLSVEQAEDLYYY